MTAVTTVRPTRVVHVHGRSALALTVATVVGLFAFLWPFVDPTLLRSHSFDAPWIFVMADHRRPLLEVLVPNAQESEVEHYEYRFARIDNELSAAIETREPLPHIEVGNYLVISDERLRLRGGHHFLIRDVEIFLDAIKPPAFNLCRVTVHIEERDRKEMLQHHRF